MNRAGITYRAARRNAARIAARAKRVQFVAFWRNSTLNLLDPTKVKKLVPPPVRPNVKRRPA